MVFRPIGDGNENIRFNGSSDWSKSRPREGSSPMSETIAKAWRSSAVKALQRQFAGYVEQTFVKSKQRSPVCG
jgi:hypothetical protein